MAHGGGAFVYGLCSRNVRDGTPAHTQDPPRELRNRLCALCNGAALTDTITAGGCKAEGTDYVATCDDGILDHIFFLQCSFLAEDLVCDAATGTTYKNAACATCHDVEATVVGECGAPPPDPCHEVDCPAHSGCARTVADCDFEAGLCGWQDGRDGEFQWTMGTGTTATSGTGPAADHTTQSVDGHYLYVEASAKDGGDEAHLVSPWFKPADLGDSCRLDFWYHAWGSHIGALSVDVKAGKGGNFTRAWKIEPPSNSAEQQHNVWKSHAHVSLADYKRSIQIRIRGERRNGGKVGVRLCNNHCNGHLLGARSEEHHLTHARVLIVCLVCVSRAG